MADIHTTLETIRAWSGWAGVTGLCAFAGRMYFTNRRLRIDERKDDRDGYGVLIATMQAAIDSMGEKHATAIHGMEERHAAEIAAMRRDHVETLTRIETEHRRCEERLSKIEGELMGFHRQALVASQSGVAMLPASPMIQEAGKRAVAALDERHAKEDAK